MTPLDILAWSGAAIAGVLALGVVVFVIAVVGTAVYSLVSKARDTARERSELAEFNRHAQEALKNVK